MIFHTLLKQLMILSDHNPITLTLNFPITMIRSQIWNLDNFLITDPEITQTISKNLAHYFTENLQLDSSPEAIWAAHKCVIRGEFISMAPTRNKLRKARIEELTKHISSLEQKHKASLVTEVLTELIHTREELLGELHKTLNRKYALTQKVFYEFGKKPGKLLARALKVKKAAHTIHRITDPAGNTLEKAEEITDQFVQYFSKLYNLPNPQLTSTSTDWATTIQEFLKKYTPSPLTTKESTDLDLPLSIEETLNALKQLKLGKSPDPDGLTLSYYKSFPDTLIPQLVKVFNNLTPSSIASKEILETHITLIPKPDKDPTLVTNYCPISLLNIDVKLYAKALANRILPLIPRLISLDQICFVPGREARDNTTKALNIHHWLSIMSTQGFLLSLDAETAFDRVARDYMEATLRAVGIPQCLLQIILALYSSPSAKIRVNGCLSGAFSFSSGMRQGCPLSPLIFILTIEPLLHRLKENPDIKGLKINHKQYKVVAYADNVLLFLTDPVTTIAKLLKDLSLFKSNLQTNFSKLKALNITLPSTLVTQCKNNFSFGWEPQAITYWVSKSLLN